MYYILVDSTSNVIEVGTKIELGIYDEPFEKWLIENSETGLKCYYIDNNFGSYEVVNVPTDFLSYKYRHSKEKGFYLNPNYVEPINTEEEVRRLTNENIDLKAQLEKVQEVLDYLVMQ